MKSHAMGNARYGGTPRSLGIRVVTPLTLSRPPQSASIWTVPAQWTPMRWPAAWKTPALLDLLRDSPVNYLLVDGKEAAQRLAADAAAKGMRLKILAEPAEGVELVKGDWPGTKAAGAGDNERAAAGPTGEPWIDSNGWRVLLAKALHP